MSLEPSSLSMGGGGYSARTAGQIAGMSLIEKPQSSSQSSSSTAGVGYRSDGQMYTDQAKGSLFLSPRRQEPSIDSLQHQRTATHMMDNAEKMTSSISTGTLKGLSRWCVSPGESALQAELNRTRNQPCVECAIIMQQNEFLVSRVKEAEEREVYLKQLSESLMTAIGDMGTTPATGKAGCGSGEEEEEMVPVRQMNLRIAEFERSSRDMMQRFDEIQAENSSLQSKAIMLNADHGEMQERLAHEIEAKRQAEGKLLIASFELTKAREKVNALISEASELRRILTRSERKYEKERLTWMEQQGVLDRKVLELSHEVESLRCVRDMEVASLKGRHVQVERNNDNQNQIRSDMVEDMSTQLQLLRDSAKIDLKTISDLKRELQRVFALASTVPALKEDIEENERAIEKLQQQLRLFDTLQLQHAQLTARMEFLEVSSREAVKKVDELKALRARDTKKHSEAMQEAQRKLEAERENQEKRGKEFARKSAIIVREILNKDQQLKDATEKRARGNSSNSIRAATTTATLTAITCGGDYNNATLSSAQNLNLSSTNIYRKRRTKQSEDHDWRLANHQGFIDFNQSQLMTEHALPSHTTTPQTERMWTSMYGGVASIPTQSPVTQRQAHSTSSQWTVQSADVIAIGASNRSHHTATTKQIEGGSKTSFFPLPSFNTTTPSNTSEARRQTKQFNASGTGTSWTSQPTPQPVQQSSQRVEESVISYQTIRDPSEGGKTTVFAAPSTQNSNNLITQTPMNPYESAPTVHRMLTTSPYEQPHENYPIKTTVPPTSAAQTQKSYLQLVPSISPLRNILSSNTAYKFKTLSSSTTAIGVVNSITSKKAVVGSKTITAPTNVSLNLTPRLSDKAKRVDTQHCTRNITPLKKTTSFYSTTSSQPVLPSSTTSSQPPPPQQQNSLRSYKQIGFFSKSESAAATRTNNSSQQSPIKINNFTEEYYASTTPSALYNS